MSDIREIVTKAIVAKGKKRFTISEKISPDESAYSILGCWVINHKFEAELKNDVVQINGIFELNVWHSVKDNTKTDVSRKEYKYVKEINTKSVISEYLENSTDVLVRVLQQPTCTNAKINNEFIEVDVIIELIAEIVGETKMQVSILSDINKIDFEEIDNMENEIEEEFLK